MCSPAVSSVLLLYTECQARGENVSLAMETSGGKQVITFLYLQEEIQDTFEEEDNCGGGVGGGDEGINSGAVNGV